MPPTVALIVWFLLLLVLLWFDPAKMPGTSLALWVPLIWMFIVGSRLTSQWLGGVTATSVNVLAEGNPLDRTIDICLISLAIATLLRRRFNWGKFLAHNIVIVVFLLFALASIFWSDFTFVAFKRWFRDLGGYFMVLVVLSDHDPLEAIRALLRRVGYLLIPLSIVINKYYPALSRQYDPWSGTFSVSGATTSKNMLGVLCLVTGLFFFWDTMTRWSDRKSRGTRRIIAVNIAFLAMAFWLLSLSNSETSRVCLILGCMVVLLTYSKTFKRHPKLFKIMIPAFFLIYLLVAFGFDLNGSLAKDLGRNPNLTDRTLIWKAALSMNTNFFVGAGYESFWMGPSLQRFWHVSGLYGINEAHNGYLEVYLNLGIIGLVLIIGFLISSYRAICKALTLSSKFASFSLAMWLISLFYCMTEAGFRSGLMWLALLLIGLTVPEQAPERLYNQESLTQLPLVQSVSGLPVEVIDWHH